ncbi:MAG: hypothetical protein HKN92_00085 [Chitinophagales bacterium]|nr:hypothetical protein [Chitinophagales bacterium]
MSFIKKTASCSNFPFEVKASATVSGAMDAYFNSESADCDLRPNTFSLPAPCDELNFNHAEDQYADGIGYCGLFGSGKNVNNLTNYLWIFLSYSKIYEDVYDADGDTFGDKFYYCPTCPTTPQQSTDVLSDATKWWITYRIALKNNDPVNYTQPCTNAFPSTSIPAGIRLLDLTSESGNNARIELRCWIDRYNSDSTATINDLLAQPCLSTPQSRSLFRDEFLNDISSNPAHPFRQGLRDNDIDSLGILTAPVMHYYCLGDDLSNSHSINSSIINPQASCMKLEKPGPSEYGHNDCFIPALKEMLDYNYTTSPYFKEHSSFFYNSGVHLQPTNLSTQIINNKIHVSWDQVGNEVKYELSFKWGSDISNLSKNGVVLSLNANTSTNFNCNAGKCTYVHPFSPIHNCYRGQVRVKKNIRCTPWSAFTNLYLEACDIPSNLSPASGSVTTGDSVTLSWSGNAQYYLIRACVGANCDPLGKGSISFTTANTSETFYNVTPANYRWTVRAICGCDVKFAVINDITVNSVALEKIQDIKELGLKVFPNPANQQLNIEIEKINTKLMIHLVSMDGKYDL